MLPLNVTWAGEVVVLKAQILNARPLFYKLSCARIVQVTGVTQLTIILHLLPLPPKVIANSTCAVQYSTYGLLP